MNLSPARRQCVTFDRIGSAYNENMNPDTPTYDPRYLAGIVLFNRGDFFEAHEVWESIWMETSGPEKKFYQGLIQAAVGLCHFCNGNGRGAVKLYKSSREYMNRYDAHFLGLDQTAFWQQMDRCFAELLAMPDPTRAVPIQEELIPTLELNPAPEAWPDPEPFLREESP
jgi:predicted metal-dependent hydrolase